MTNNPLFYKEVVPLDRRRHASLFLAQQPSYRYAATTNSVLLTLVEFIHASREYPIVFGNDGQSTFPLAILGLRDNENLFVTPEGKWQANYIPAYVRRYPFILSTQADSDNLTVCIDRSSANINSDAGLRLFENDQETDFLKGCVNFLKDYQTQHALTQQVCTRIKDLNILEPMQANIELNTGAKLNMGGFLAVNRQRLINLPAEQLAGLVRDGILELIYLHLHSMDNFGRLVERFTAHPKNLENLPKNLENLPTAGNA